MNISLHFDGPFTFTEGERSAFRTGYSGKAGIYLWTIEQHDASHLIHFIGETQSFSRIHKEHLVNILGLNYGIFDPVKAKSGIADLIWEGLWQNNTQDGPGQVIRSYSERHETVIQYLNSINIFFAKIDPNVEQTTRQQIEYGINLHLRKHHPEYSVLFPDESFVDTGRYYKNGDLEISCSRTILGLGSQVRF
jgi:hypothetical protein